MPDLKFKPINTGHKLPFKVEGYNHVASDGLAAGIKDADGMWVAKMHPLNGTTEDLKRSEVLSLVFAAAPEAMVALQDLIAQASGLPKSCGHDFVCDCPFAQAKTVLKAAGLLP